MDFFTPLMSRLFPSSVPPATAGPPFYCSTSYSRSRSRKASSSSTPMASPTCSLALRDSHAWARQRTRPAWHPFPHPSPRLQRPERTHSLSRKELRKTYQEPRIRRCADVKPIRRARITNAQSATLSIGPACPSRSDKSNFPAHTDTSEQLDESQDFWGQGFHEFCMKGADLGCRHATRSGIAANTQALSCTGLPGPSGKQRRTLQRAPFLNFVMVSSSSEVAEHRSR